MKISKNILTSALVILITLSIMIGTLVYANQYTISHATQNNSFQKGNTTMHQGGPSNGDIRKPKN